MSKKQNQKAFLHTIYVSFFRKHLDCLTRQELTRTFCCVCIKLAVQTDAVLNGRLLCNKHNRRFESALRLEPAREMQHTVQTSILRTVPSCNWYRIAMGNFGDRIGLCHHCNDWYLSDPASTDRLFYLQIPRPGIRHERFLCMLLK